MLAWRRGSASVGSCSTVGSVLRDATVEVRHAVAAVQEMIRLQDANHLWRAPGLLVNPG
jgi:hypothetical protein